MFAREHLQDECEILYRENNTLSTIEVKTEAAENRESLENQSETGFSGVINTCKIIMEG